MSLAERIEFEPSLTDVRTELCKYSEKVDRAVDLAKEVFVIDEKSAQDAMNFASEARKMQKSIESTRLAITHPSRSFISEVNLLAKGYSSRLEQVVDIIQQKICLWKEDTRIKDLDNTAEMYCDELGMSFEITNQTDLSKIRSVGGTAYERAVWKYEILDYRTVPIDFLEINDSSVKLAIRNGERNIPGLRIYKETKTSFRSR